MTLPRTSPVSSVTLPPAAARPPLRPAWFWKGVAWWGKHQRWWWVFVIGVTLAWVGYDIGRMVARADLIRFGGNTSGTITVNDVLITSTTSARFHDAQGQAWEVSDFGAQVNRDVLDILKKQKVDIDGEAKITLVPVQTTPKDLIFSAATDLLVKVAFLSIYGFIVYMLIRMLGQSQARYRTMNEHTRPTTRIVDVAGHTGAKREVTEFIEYLRDPERFARAGARPPRGVLLYGPPGNGKTMLAKAIAGEADASFIEQSGSAFIQVYAGAGAQSVRKLFEQARKKVPCVIFIDEIDAIGGSRDAGGAHDERIQSLNALLAEMDGFGVTDGILVIAATNRLETLDAALVRPGRFDRKVHVPLPSRPDREAILATYIDRLPEAQLDVGRIAGITAGWSAAELMTLVNEGAIEAVRQGETRITEAHMDAARERMLLGVTDPDRRLSSRDKKVVAVHELGHAFMRLIQGQRIEKVSIIPRGMALGVTLTSPDLEERNLHTLRDVQEALQVMMGGRAAEQVCLGECTGGAEDDLRRASDMARMAINRWGFGKQGAYVPLHAALMERQEEEAFALVQEALESACNALTTRRTDILQLADLLIHQEELDGKELESFFHNERDNAALSGCDTAEQQEQP